MTDQMPAPPPLPPHGAYQANEAADAAKGFIGALFDFSFSSFVTPKIVKFVYIVLVILLPLTWLGWIIAGFSMHVVMGVVALLFGWIPLLLALAFYRMTLELLYSVVNMNLKVESIERNLRR